MVTIEDNPALHNFNEDCGLVYINSHHLACHRCLIGSYDLVFLENRKYFPYIMGEPFLYCTNCYSIDVNF